MCSDITLFHRSCQVSLEAHLVEAVLPSWILPLPLSSRKVIFGEKAMAAVECHLVA